MVQHPIKISEENSKNSRFYGYLKLVSILSHFRARTLYTQEDMFMTPGPAASKASMLPITLLPLRQQTVHYFPIVSTTSQSSTRH